VLTFIPLAHFTLESWPGEPAGDDCGPALSSRVLDWLNPLSSATRHATLFYFVTPPQTLLSVFYESSVATVRDLARVVHGELFATSSDGRRRAPATSYTVGESITLTECLHSLPVPTRMILSRVVELALGATATTTPKASVGASSGGWLYALAQDQAGNADRWQALGKEEMLELVTVSVG
jgi:hypothetical protein